MTISNNLKRICEDVRMAAENAGRNGEDITIVAVSKRFPASSIKEAIDAGQTVFGENYIQEAEDKIAELGPAATFHFIGHLQSNKAKTAARLFEYIETIDRFKLAKVLNNHLETLNKKIKILVQVNIGNDPNKSGVTEEGAEQLLRDIQHLKKLLPVGLMTMPPLTSSPEESRPYFRKLRNLSERLDKLNLFTAGSKPELSMGMSADYRIAIEEGATIIRVGTAIFGTRS